ncbi:MAG: bifunctional riboflavin kinase/FAD synthetase [Gemmatimonadota bacterium]
MSEPSAVTVGTFDGVHRGHQEVLDELVSVARERGERSVLVTFDPHPVKIVRPVDAPQLLTTPHEKEEIIAQYGIDVIAHVRFTYELSQYEPERFVREILIGRYGLSHLVIGYDHGFGRGRRGDVETLKRIGAEIGFEVDIVKPYRLNGDNVSSSKIRKALLHGDVVSAAAGLGRAYSLRGTVVRGDGRGRELDMPTANLEVADPDKLIPLEGIYAVRANGRPGVAHLGPRPTFEQALPSIEVHLFDFSGDLYGQMLKVEFVDRIRGIERFDSMAELAAAMRNDGQAARRILSGGGAGGGAGAGNDAVRG